MAMIFFEKNLVNVIFLGPPEASLSCWFTVVRVFFGFHWVPRERVAEWLKRARGRVVKASDS